MKKLYLFLLGLVLLVPASLQAQSDDKGFFVEGNLSYASDFWKNYKRDGGVTDEFFIITPAVGYQINEKWSVGFKVGFSTSGDFTFNWNSYTPFVRYNILSFGKTCLFTEAKVSKFDWNEILDGGRNNDFIEAGFSLGVSYPFNEHLKLVCQYLHIGYSNEYRDSNKRCSKHGLNLHSGDWVLDANIKRLSIGLNWTF